MAGPEALSSRDSQSLGKVPPHSLEAEQIDTENQVKEIGLHTISLVLGPDTKFETTLEIIPETK